MGIKEITEERKKKRDLLAKDSNPYPAKAKRTHEISSVVNDFDKLTKESVSIAGRIRSIRTHGGSTFAHVEDGTGRVQVYLKKDEVGEGYKQFIDTADVGDFVSVTGSLFTTKKGEKTVLVNEWEMLTKTLLPLPEKWHGLQDKEERFRKRYLDLVANEKVRDLFLARTNIIKATRSFYDKEGFQEVETPILQPLYGGASAEPFTTHLNTLDFDLFLRIAPELYLKRLLVGGIDRVYEIGRCFRNEGMDPDHNPDFTMLESYQAYTDYEDLMEFLESLMVSLTEKDRAVEFRGNKIEFKAPFKRLELSQLIKDKSGIDIDSLKDKESLAKEAEKIGIEVTKEMGWGKIVDEIYKKKCVGSVIQPTFVINFPAEILPLAKQLPDDPTKTQSLQLIIGGLEIGKGFTEQNDPEAQRKAFEEQKKLLDAGDKEAQKLDEDFIEALEHGMPPAAGYGMGVDRLVMLLTDAPSLREVILFPTMKPKQ